MCFHFDTQKHNDHPQADTDAIHGNRACAEKIAHGGFVTAEASVRGVGRLQIWAQKDARRA